MGEDSNGTQFTPIHNTHPAIHNTHHHTSPPTTHNTKGKQDSTRCRTQSEDGAPQHTHPPFNTATQQTTRGTPTHRREGRHHNAALHSPCHPTSSYHPPPNDSPTHHHERGEDRRRIPHHTKTTDTHTTHTPQHMATRQ